MNSLFAIGKTATILNVDLQTLRRWDADKEKLHSRRSGTAGHRYYRIDEIEDFLSRNFKYLLRVGKRWGFEKNIFDMLPRFYCSDRSIFKARLSKLEGKLMKEKTLSERYSLIVSIVGEIGNNSFDHNLGNWPDTPGIFFAYSLQENKIILADRGQGILKTLKRIKKGLKNDKQALKVAFTEIISGRAPENRGNGLKFVRSVVENNDTMRLFFQTGNAFLNLSNKNSQLNINIAQNSVRGCFAVIQY